MSQMLHRLLHTRVARLLEGIRELPILLAQLGSGLLWILTKRNCLKSLKGKEAGVELFVLDDGWFGNRIDDHRALGDWKVDTRKLPNG